MTKQRSSKEMEVSKGTWRSGLKSSEEEMMCLQENIAVIGSLTWAVQVAAVPLPGHFQEMLGLQHQVQCMEPCVWARLEAAK